MDTERFQRVRAWFDQLADLDDAERRARLASEEPDPEVRARVLALLARSTVGTGLDGQAVSGLLGAITADAPKTGSVLGAWTLIGVLGEGGMGTVFEAQRSDGHFQQTAALKVLKGLPSQAALAYLARERQILAGLTHPNIARLLDGGATPGGQPYFVMAMQEGLPIDQYCAERKLGSAAILRLMLPVCDAISYAHARLVIHCDLKPSNILVDTQGRPCVLDFGIARPLDEPLASSQPSSSSLRVRAFTPGFASPELEAGHAVTTATDVFSLGRLLECLLGDHRIDAELSALIRRACASEPTDRYGAVADFRADLEARLDGQPLAAMPKTFSYGAKKWLRRHWQVAVAVMAFVVLTGAFTAQTIRERDRARVAEQQAVLERDRARQAETSARQISDFLVSILDGANPDAGSGEVPTSKLVTQALARIDTELAGQPAVQAELYATLASVLSVLGNDELAHESIQKAIALTRTLDRPDQLVTQLQQLVALRLESFDARDAVAPAREVLSVLEGLKDTTPKMLAEARQDLGSILSMQGDPEGFELLKQVAEAQRTLDPNGLGLMDALHAMAGYHLGKREFAEAETLLRECLELQLKYPPSDHERLLNTKEMLGRTLSDLKRPDEAEQFLREALMERRKLMGEDDPHIPWRLTELARVLDNHGRSMEALPLYKEALELAARKIGEDTPAYAVMLNGYAMSLQRVGDWPASDRTFDRAIAVARARWGPQNLGYATMNLNHALLLMRMGRLVEARKKAAEVEQVRAGALAAHHADLAFARLALAEIDCESDDPVRARAWLDQFAATVPDASADLRSLSLAAESCLARRAGNRDQAIALLAEADSLITKTSGYHHPQRLLNELMRAELLHQRNQGNDRADAKAVALAILDAIDSKFVPNAPVRGRLARLIQP